ncbi:MAG: 3'(2'),5'-bisphosphate nucleotidase CysQ [Rikenellaceae bacterium]|nr:3'(2'),5'-bisphosphate nucleotidase CysQ [Rikenellaceae bacterium]
MEKSYLKTALRAAVEAGGEIMSVYTLPDEEFGLSFKDDESPLTVADKKAHEKICFILDETGIPILSEEGESKDFSVRKNWNTMWIVDPLDGTKEFIRRNGEFTVNIALVENGVPIAGVIYVPVKKILYYSDKNGAYKAEIQDELSLRNLSRISVKIPEEQHREKFTIVASRSHMYPVTEKYIDEKKKLHGEIEIVSCGSSLKICKVAEGSADEYPRFGPTMEWDTAAGHAIASAAGKELIDVGTGCPLRYNKESLLNPFFIVK